MAKKSDPVNPLGQKRLYFPSLDGLRFFAFFTVFLHHSLFVFSSSNPIINNFLVAIKKNGWLGVDLFFVLSGFLITTLLLKEREQNGSYSLKNFWIRRALRIWPLYYLALIMGFWIVPFIFGTDYSSPAYDYQIHHDPPFYALFLGNWIVSTQGYSFFSNISHLWTISLEEQFYFIWPIILLFVKNFKQSVLVGSSVILFSLLTRLFLGLNQVPHPGIYTNTFARIDILTLGAILALIYHHKPHFIERIKPFLQLKFQFITLIILTYLMYRISVFEPSILRNVVFGYLGFGLIMVYFTVVSLQENSPTAKFLSKRLFVFLGKISYGLYVWHVLALEIGSQLSRKLHTDLLTPIFGLTLTIIFGVISYYFFEVRFLRLKSRFTSIKSRPI